jgi:hypothetical protein
VHAPFGAVRQQWHCSGGPLQRAIGRHSMGARSSARHAAASVAAIGTQSWRDPGEPSAQQ